MLVAVMGILGGVFTPSNINNLNSFLNSSDPNQEKRFKILYSVAYFLHFLWLKSHT